MEWKSGYSLVVHYFYSLAVVTDGLLPEAPPNEGLPPFFMVKSILQLVNLPAASTFTARTMLDANSMQGLFVPRICVICAIEHRFYCECV